MTIDTWAGRSTFKYTGCVAVGTGIEFGNLNFINVTAEQYSNLRNSYLGQIVVVGTSFDNPPPGSLVHGYKQMSRAQQLHLTLLQS